MKNHKFYMLNIYKIIWRNSPILSVLIISFYILSALIPTWQILIVANFINVMLENLRHDFLLNRTFGPILFLVLTIISNYVVSLILEFLQTRLVIKLKKTISVELTNKRSKIKYHYFENAESCDLINRVATNPEVMFTDIYYNQLKLLMLFIRFMGVISILFTYIWWSGIVMLMTSIPLFCLSIKGGNVTYNAKKKTEGIRRHSDYIKGLLTNRDSAEERTFFRSDRYLIMKWYGLYEMARKAENKVKIKWMIFSKASGIMTSLIGIVNVLVLLGPVLNHQLSSGVYISIINATFSLVTLMTWSLSTIANNIANNKKYAKEYYLLMSMEEEMFHEDKVVFAVPKFDYIEFHNVSFRYPNSIHYILKNVNLRIEAGRHYSLVGKNGAGKTTIVKLMMGLYDDYEGSIVINGFDYRDLSLDQIRSFFCAIYQDYTRYQLSIKENIFLGRKDHHMSEDELNDIAKKLDFNTVINSYPQGVETKLGKIYPDGIDLSGGQWQKIALARMLASQAPVSILDEPTASLDPINESKIYTEFGKLVLGRTSLLISHRLGSTKMADVIIVVDGGQVVGVGSHEELTANNSLYTQMYESQRGWYVQ